MKRTLVAAAASAAALASIIGWEQYSGTAYMPTPQDRPTLGFGSTTRADGRPVRPGDKTDPVRAVQKAAADADATARAIGACIGPVPLYQREWDAYVSLAYNIGPQAFCSSTLVRLLHQTPPDYTGACKQVLRWDKQAGRTLAGLTRRRQAEYRQCMGEAP